MAANHFIGEGDFSDPLLAACGDPPSLLAVVAAAVREAVLQVVADQAVPFTGGGATLVWVLAESHMVLHLWPELGRATLDLHVCDYRDSNRARAGRLRDALDALCFAPGSAVWRELAVRRRGSGRWLIRITRHSTAASGPTSAPPFRISPAPVPRCSTATMNSGSCARSYPRLKACGS